MENVLPWVTAGKRLRAGLQDVVELVSERIVRQIFHLREL